jgi:site-specific DNA-methyltransferase (adenine-specific)
MLNLHNIDCIKYMKTMSDNSVTLTLTDIPYDVVNNYECGIREYNKGKADEITFDLQTFIDETVRITSGSIYVFCSTEQVSQLRGEYAKAGLSTRLCIWEKTNPSPVHGDKFWLSSIECCVFARKSKATFNEHCSSAVWRASIEKKVKHHPTPKPIKLLSRIIKASTQPGDIVFDPCSGSGSTAMACKGTRRNFIGCELDVTFYDNAVKWVDSYDESKIEYTWNGTADVHSIGPLGF